MSSLAKFKRRWLSNAFVNLIGGLFGAIVNLLMPAIVARQLDGYAFSTWTLATQVALIVGLMGAGLQTATARFVSRAAEQTSAHHCSYEVVLASRSIARRASLVALVAILFLVVWYPALFPDIPSDLLGIFRVCVVLFGLGAILQILVLPDMGFFQGVHRNGMFVYPVMVARGASVLFVWLGSLLHVSMLGLAILAFVGTCLIWPLFRAIAKGSAISPAGVGCPSINSALRLEILQYCFSLIAWSFAMLLVNTFGMLFVGRIELSMAGPFAIAMAAVSVVVGLFSAVLSPLITNFAAIHAQNDSSKALPSLLFRLTLGVSVALNVAFDLVVVCHQKIIEAWVGSGFVETSSSILLILVAGHCVRNIAAPYALALLAVGLHRKALIFALLEGGVNVLASALFGSIWGVPGVAFGTLVAAVLGVIGMLFFNAVRTPELTPRPRSFFATTVVLPLIFFIPLHMWLLGQEGISLGSLIGTAISYHL
jgi:O-antigen/teichoic acid export membrane protein